MPNRRGGSAGASNDVGEQQPEEDEAQDVNSRFLQQRKRQNADSSYHPTHDKKAVARIPPIQRGESSTQRQREEVLMVRPLDDIHPRDIAFMKQNAAHLPDDVLLEVLASFDYNPEDAIEDAKQMVKPVMMGEPIKNMIVANIAMEKEKNPTKRSTWKEFYMENMMKGAVDTRALVDFYYKEKNKLGGNWRMEYDDPPETPEMREDLERRMNNAGITLVARDAAAVRNQIRAQRNPSVPTRQSVRSRKSEVERLLDNSDSGESASGTPSNQPSTSASNQPSTSGEPPSRINMRFRFRPSQPGGNPSNISIIHTDNQPSTSTASTSRSAPRPAPAPEADAEETPRRRHSTRISSGASQDQPQQQSPQSPQRRGSLNPNRKRKST